MEQSYSIRSMYSGMIFSLVVIISILQNSNAQWEGSGGITEGVLSFTNSPNGEFYAGTASGVFRYQNIEDGWVRVGQYFGPYVFTIAVNGESIFAGTSSGIYRNDGDSSWVSLKAFDSTLTVTKIFIKDSTIYAGTQDNGLFRSDDDGNNWALVDSGLNYVRTFIFIDSILFLGAEEGIYRSGDGGNNWSNISNIEVYSMAMIETYMFHANSNGVFRSSNFGNTWERMEYIRARSLATSGDTIFAAGEFGNGVVIFSLDKGDTWHDFSEGMPFQRSVGPLAIYNEHLFAGFAYTNCSGSCSGLLGYALKRPLTEIPVSVNPYSVSMKKRSMIKQVDDKIEFTLIENSWLNLSLYTPTGKLVSTLIEGEYGAGIHRVSVDIKSLPKGLYIVQLKGTKLIGQKVLMEN